MVLELWGCGFNAHGQLRGGEGSDGILEDIRTPQLLTTASHSLRPLFVGWSDLILEKDQQLCRQGAAAAASRQTPLPQPVVGNHTGILSLPADRNITHAAIAGNDYVCLAEGNNRLFSYNDPSTLNTHSRVWSIPTNRIQQLLANESSFALLTVEGEVYTWGDGRHSLGRDIVEAAADEPAVAPALEGLCMDKIALGGWIGVAMSEARDLYIWGQAGLGGEDAALDFLPAEQGEVGLVDLGDDVDVVDVAVGGGHVVVLTADGDVVTAGRNENGQTGIPGEAFQGSWKKWERPWEGRAVAVYSGPFAWCSLVVVERG